MKNGNMSKCVGKQHALACASFILIITTLSSCKSMEAEKCLSVSEVMAQKYVQTKRWLALRLNESKSIVVVCRDESIAKWAVLSNGEWQVFSLVDKSNFHLLKTDLPEPLENINDCQKVLIKRGEFGIFQVDNILKDIPACRDVWYGDSNELRWKLRDSLFLWTYFVNKTDGSVVSVFPLSCSEDFVVLAEESTYSELLAALKKRGEKVIWPIRKH